MFVNNDNIYIYKNSSKIQKDDLAIVILLQFID